MGVERRGGCKRWESQTTFEIIFLNGERERERERTFKASGHPVASRNVCIQNLKSILHIKTRETERQREGEKEKEGKKKTTTSVSVQSAVCAVLLRKEITQTIPALS